MAGRILQRFTLKQVLLIVVPAITTIAWCVLLLAFARGFWQDARASYVDYQSRLLQTFIDANQMSLRVGDYPELQRQLNTVVLGTRESYLGIVDENAEIVDADLEQADTYRRLLAVWDQQQVQQQRRNSALISFTGFPNAFFVFDMVLTDPSAARPFGRLVAFVSDRDFREKETAMVRRFVLIGLVLLCVQLAMIILLTKKLVQPLERFVQQWQKSESGTAPVQQELLRTAEASTKDLFELSRAIGAVLARQAMAVALGRFTAQIAHDMRSPLTTMQSYLRFAGSDVDPDQLAALREAVVKGLEKLSNMAEELLDYARASRIEKQPVDLVQVCRDAIAEVQSGASTQIQWQYEGPESLKSLIDPSKLQRVLSNVMQNAVQAMSQGGTITVCLVQLHQGVQLKIRDSGCGIRPEHLSRIFESTFTFGKKQGTGLGLDYCKTVVEGHGGIIDVSSTVGEGTEFTIRLPSE